MPQFYTATIAAASRTTSTIQLDLKEDAKKIKIHSIIAKSGAAGTTVRVYRLFSSLSPEPLCIFSWGDNDNIITLKNSFEINIAKQSLISFRIDSLNAAADADNNVPANKSLGIHFSFE